MTTIPGVTNVRYEGGVEAGQLDDALEQLRVEQQIDDRLRERDRNPPGLAARFLSRRPMMATESDSTFIARPP